MTLSTSVVAKSPATGDTVAGGPCPSKQVDLSYAVAVQSGIPLQMRVLQSTPRNHRELCAESYACAL
jgi:hypothetical protein